jgi:hypothetical protein
MTGKEFDKLYDRIGFISNQLGVLVEYARIADTRGRAIAEMWESQERLAMQRRGKEIEKDLQGQTFKGTNFDPNKWYEETKTKPITLDVRPYDWWRLENGYYAKVYKTQLQGEIYQEDGKMLQHADWNPLSLVSMDRLDGKWNLKNRKSGDNPTGWPDWCK